MSAIDPQKVLRSLSVVASRQEVDEVPSGVFQKAFGQSDTSTSAKLLASDLIHLGALHDSDWDVVTQSLKDGMSSSDPEAQIVALQILPSLPAQHLTSLVLKDDLGEFVVVCLNDGNPDLRSGAVVALGHLLVHSAVVKGLSEYPEKSRGGGEYWSQICDCLVDPDDKVAGSAFSAVRSLMTRSKNLQENDAAAPWGALTRQWSDQCFRAIHQNLAAVLHRSNDLDASGLVSAIDVLSGTALESLKGTDMALQRTMIWALSSVGSFLESNLASVDTAVIHRCAASLLQLCKECSTDVSQSWAVTSAVSLESWSSKAIAALEDLLESKETVPARGDIILTITQHLNRLDLAEVGVVARRLLQNISALPRSHDRTRSLMRLWRSVLSCDLKLRRLRQSRGDVVLGGSLQSLLENPFFSGVVAGHQKQNTDFQLNKAISKASYPAYKQELVCSLMEVIMEYAQSFDIKSVFPKRHEVPAESTKELSLESAIQTDIQTDVVDWFAAAVVALYLTQACLGWDNFIYEGYYGLTLPADLWLQLLQLTSQTLYTILAHYNIRFLGDLRSLSEEASKSRTGKVLKTLAGEAFEIQKLMKRMVFYWSFLNAALKPRVFWVVCHHIELPDKVDDVWTYLADCLKDLLITRPTELVKRQQEGRIAASKEGKLGPTNESMYNVKPTDDAKAPPVAFTQSEVSYEGMTVGLLCLVKLTEALTQQYGLADFADRYDKVRDIALLLKKICTQILEEDFLTVDMFDQCKSVLKHLDFVVENPPEGHPTEMSRAAGTETEEQESEQGGTFLPVDLTTKNTEGFPFSNSNSLGFVSNKRARRHKALRWNLMTGHDGLTPKTTQQGQSTTVPPVPEKPTPVDLAAAVGGLNIKEDESEWKVLTGQGDPIQLSIRHQVDAFKRILTVEISAENKMGSSDITGAVVSFAVEGPVASDREGLIVWHPEKLPAQEAAVHRFELGLTEFGAIEIQPFMDVALHGSDEEMPALSCSAYSIPLVDLLVPVTSHPSSKVFFQEVSSWSESLRTTAVCRWSGTNGAMQLLSALRQPRIKKIWPQTMQALSIFQAVYLLQTFNNVWISLAITGQLVDLQRMGLAAWTVPSEASVSGNTGYYLCKCTFTSTSTHVIASLRAQTAEILSDLSGGGLVLGLDPGVGRPPPPPPVHPDLYVNLSTSQAPTQFPDMQSIALEEWKRLNRASD